MTEPRVANPKRRSTIRVSHRQSWAGTTADIYRADGGLDEVGPATLRHEHRLLTRLAGSAVPRVLGFEESADGVILALESLPGRPLREVIERASGRLKLATALKLGAALVEALRTVHERDVVHGDIRPENVVVGDDSAVMLIGFGDAHLPGEERVDGILEAALPYIAPEQTRRVLRSVDFRSDFYSVGVVLFECLAGRRPFVAPSAAELIHCHIARQPPALIEVVEGVPLAVSDLVDRTLAKEPDARYQSHAGFVHDLRELAEAADQGDEQFLLGEYDIPRQLSFPPGLIGRADAAAALRASFERARAGSLEFAVISGSSGIGKTSLVNALRRPALAAGGIFTVGKCDQRRRGPYEAPALALRYALRRLQLESEARLDFWRARFRERMGGNAAVLFDLLPELSLLLGGIPAAAPLPPRESEVRFRTTLVQALTALAVDGRPLVLFLDDVQWADLLTFDLLREIATSADSSLLVIVAYRDDELDSLSQLPGLLDDPDVAVTFLHLDPLTEAESRTLIRAVLPRCAGDLAQLARVVHAKARGNPLFLRAYLQALVENSLLHFDTARGGWTWELTDLRHAPVSDDIASILSGRLRGLPTETLRALQHASCIGDQFSAELLAAIVGSAPRDVSECLWDAVSAGVIAPLAPGESLELGTPYRFAHDRVKEAAYDSITAEDRERTHLRVGRILLAEGDDDDKLFDIVRHLNAAGAQSTAPDERLRLAKLNLKAGRLTRLQTAYTAAVELLHAAIALLPEDAWTGHRALCTAIHRECMTAEHLAARYDEASRRAEILLHHADSARTRAEIHLMQANLETSRGEHRRVLEHGRAGLALLGVRLPRKGNPLAVAARLVALQVRLRGLSAAELAALPAMRDPTQRLVLDLLMAISPSAYMVDSNLLPWIGLRMVSLSLTHGLSAPSAYALLVFGILELGVLGRYDHAQRTATAAESIHSRFPDPFLTVRVEFLVASYFRAWKRPLLDIAAALERCHALGLHNGDLLYASFCTGNRLHVLLTASAPLAEVERYGGRVVDFVARVQGVDAECLTRGIIAMVRALRGAGPELGLLDDGDFALDVFEARLSDDRTPLTHFHFAMHRAMVAVHFDRNQEAAGCIRRAITLEERALGNSVLVMYWFYQAFVAGRRYAAAGPRERRGLRRILRRSETKLRAARASSAENFAAHHQCALALLDVIRGRHDRALTGFGDAAALARRNKAHQIEAIACELAADLARDRNDPHLGRFFVESSRRAYLAWGADGVAARLTSRYREWLRSDHADETSLRYDDRQLDLEAALEASRALTGEIVLTRLLARLVEILMTNAGARRCFVILAENDVLTVRAVGDVHREGVDIVDHGELTAYRGLSTAIVQYVVRTREEVVLSGELGGTPFDGDPTVEATRSALCTPLLYQEELLGVVYLDNDLARGVFTESRVDFLRELVGHVAIAVRNAKLYRELDLVRERAVSADRAKSRFFLNMSHEVRTPLNAVLGFADLGLEQLAEGDVAGVGESLRHIDASGRHLLRTLARILELSRLESGEIEVHPERIDLGELFAFLRAEHSTPASNTGNVLVTKVAPGLPVLTSDRELLLMLLTCLLENAYRFSHDSEITLAAEIATGGVAIAVEDHGIGIAGDMLERIFARFVQADDSSTRAVEGAGIGLAIARGIADRLGGELAVTSEVGVGSRFVLRLPLGDIGESNA